MAANVLFDEPGPRTRTRHRLYSLLFLIGAAAVLTWTLMKLSEAGQLEPEIFERLTQDNVLRAFRMGVLATLKAAALGIAGAVVLGLVLAAARLSERRWVSLPALAFTEFFRAVPLLLLIIFMGFFLVGKVDGTESRGLAALVIALTIYNGTVLAEVFRAGINAVPRGQSEAAYALGLRKSQVMSIVLLPQAVRFMLPAIISQCVIVLKDSALGFIVVYPELLREAKLIAEYADNHLMTYLFAAAIYIFLNSLLSIAATWLERRSARSGSGKQLAATEAALPMT